MPFQSNKTDYAGAGTSTNGQVMAQQTNYTRDQLINALRAKGVPESLIQKEADAAMGAQANQNANPAAQNIYTQNASDVAQAQQQQQQALLQQQALIDSLKAAGGIQNQSQVYNQGQALAGQLQDMANGKGPSIAQAQLANATGANVANQAALMAGQRGAGANAGLMARQIGQQGAGIQQNAAGQSALLRNQEQLGAIGALQQQQGMLGNLATQQVGQQQSAIGQLGQQTLSNQGQQFGALQNQNAQISGNANQTNQINSGAEQANTKAGNSLAGGLLTGGLSGLGSAITSGFATKKAEGGMIYPGKSKVGAHLHAAYSQGGQVKAMVSPGEIYLSPEQAELVKQGKMNPMDGERFQGKAKVKGDSTKNDVIPTILEAGGVVIKRTKAMDEESAKKFVKAVKARK